MAVFAVVTVTTPATGRGAWPAKGTGGTLSLDGLQPGRFYRNPIAGLPMPGMLAWAAIRLGQPVSVNEYAVYLAVRALQTRCGLVADGLFGPNTAAAVQEYQRRAGLVVDGIVGSTTAKHMVKPIIASEVAAVANAHPRLGFLTGGFLAWESGLDFGAVGVTTPTDVGLAQINGPAHPDMTLEQRFDPVVAVGFTAGFVEASLDQFPREADAVASYNLGRQGTRNWIAAGRPQMWGKTDVPRYISAILSAAATV